MKKLLRLFKNKYTPIVCLLLCVALLATGTFSVVNSVSLNGKIDALTAQISSLEKDLENKNGDYNSIKSDLEAAQQEIEDYEAELVKYRKLVNTLQSLNQEQKDLINELTTPLNGRDEKTAEPADTKIAYLTFDDGPSEHTEEILKILTEKQAVATFFVINNRHLNKITNIINQGSAVAMHSMTHDYEKIYSSVDGYFNDLYAIEGKIFEISGVKPKIMRLPGGASNAVSKKYKKGVVTEITNRLNAEGYVYFDWNVDSTDASKNGVPAATLVEKITEGAKGKQVINVLMHDTALKKTTVEALPQIIDALRAEGYTFMTLSPTSTKIQHTVNN